MSQVKISFHLLCVVDCFVQEIVCNRLALLASGTVPTTSLILLETQSLRSLIAEAKDVSVQTR
jgi:hypothetical protein